MFSFKKWLADHQVSEEVRESMLREYSILLYIGGLFMNYEPKFAVLSLVQFSIFFFNNLLYIVIFVVTSFKAPSLIGLSQYLNYLSLAIISLGIYTTAFSHRDTVIRQLEILARDFYDYGSTFDNKDAATWKADLRKFKIIILIAIPSYLAIIGVCVLFANWIDLLFGYETDDIEYKGDIYQKSPIPLWHPYYIDSGITRAMATMGQIIEAVALSLSLGSADVLMLMLGQTVSLQLRILCSATIKLDDRADRMYRELTNGLEPTQDRLERSKDEILGECYRRAIKQLVEHHLIVQEFYDLYNDLAKWPAGFAVLNGSIMIAMSIMVVTVGTSDRPSTYLNAGLLLIAEVTSMWLLCETRQQVNGWSEELYFSLYEFDWTSLGPKNKKMILIFKEKAKSPLLMMAGGLTPINRDTFATIMNSAYSYINLLRASEKQ